MLIGKSDLEHPLPEEVVRGLVEQAFQTWDPAGQRVLVIIPDSTRSMPLPLFFRLFYDTIGARVAALDYLVALGTHPLMSQAALERLVGITAQERQERFARVGLYNHRWDRPETFVTLGTLGAEETAAISQGMLAQEVPVRVNRMVLDYDLVVVCGPVFPHEVVGFSGGNKYFFPGTGGPEVINFTHWLGALITSFAVIGTKHTPVREMIDRAAAFIQTPKLCFCSVVKDQGLRGLFVGEPQAAWSAAAGLSAQLHIQYLAQPFEQVISALPAMYDDLWTGAKGMYKVEPVVAEGGEVVLYAPHIDEISYTHGPTIDAIGYHVRDYFVKQWPRFRDVPWGVLAHSTHLRGVGTFENGLERPRIRVTLATGIPRERCERVNLGYRDPEGIRPAGYAGREADGILLVPHAGEILYRLR